MARDPPKTRAVEPPQAVEVDFVESNVENEFVNISAPSAERAPKVSTTPKADADKHVESKKMASDSNSCDSGVSSSLEKSDSKKQERCKEGDPLAINWLHWVGSSFIVGILILFCKSLSFESLVLFITTSSKNFTPRRQNNRDHDSVIIDVSAALIDLCTITAVLSATIWLHLYIARSKSTAAEAITDETEQPEADKKHASADRHGDEPKEADDIAVRQDSSLIWPVCGILFALPMLHKLIASRMDFKEFSDCFPTGLLRSVLLLFSSFCLFKGKMKADPVVIDAQDYADGADFNTWTSVLPDIFEYTLRCLRLAHWACFTVQFILILLAAGPESRWIAMALAYTSRFGLVVVTIEAVSLGVAELLHSIWLESTAHTVGAKIKAVAAKLRQKAIHFAVWCRQHPARGLGLVILIMTAASALSLSFEHTKEVSSAPIDTAIEQSVDFIDRTVEMKKIMQELLEHLDRIEEHMKSLDDMLQQVPIFYRWVFPSRMRQRS